MLFRVNRLATQYTSHIGTIWYRPTVGFCCS